MNTPSLSEPSLGAARALADRIRDSGFDAAEVSLRRRRLTEMQIDAGDVSLLRNTDAIELGLRGIVDGRHATVSLNQTDEDSVQRAIAALAEAAAAAPRDEARALAPAQGLLHRDTGPTEPQLDPMHERVTALAATVRERHPELLLEQAMLQFHRIHQWRANTLGLEVDASEGFYAAEAMFSSRRGARSSSFNGFAGTASQLDTALLDWAGLSRLMASSVREIDHQALAGRFDGPVLLTPESLFSLVDFWLSHLGDDRLIAGSSRLRDSIDQPVASPLFTLRVAPDEAGFARREFVTADGYPCEASTLVEGGLLRSFMLSDYGARKTGLPRARNAAVNRIVEAGSTPLVDIVKQIPRGLMLGRFSGGYPAANGDFSGVAKNSFLIENGEVTTPVSEVMIAGNLFEMMRSISAVSAERVNDGMTLLPWIRTEGLSISGQ